MTVKKKLGILLIAALAAVPLGLKFFGGKKTEGSGLSYKPVQVVRGDIRNSVLSTGQVQPENRLEIKPPIGGRMEQVLVVEGEGVKNGQILAWVSSTERAALLDAARAKGPEEFAHWQELYKPTPLIAPLDGVIIARNVEPGQTVTAQDAVLVMSDRLIVKASVDETDIGQIRLNQKASITLDAYPGQAVSARVDHIAYEAKTTNNVTTYEVDVVPDEIPDFMRSGMTANVTFVTAFKEHVLIVPVEAVNQDGGSPTVWVPDPSGKKGRASFPVEVGIGDGKRMEILSGLKESDTILVPVMRVPHSGGAKQTNPFSPMGSRPRQTGQQGGGGRSS